MAAIVASYRDQLANLDNLRRGVFTPALNVLSEREAEARKIAQKEKEFVLEQEFANKRFEKQLAAQAEQRKQEREQERLFLQQDRDTQLLEGAMLAQQTGNLPKDVYIPTPGEGVTPAERAYFTNAIQEMNALRSPEEVNLRARLLPLQQEASQAFERDPFNNMPAPVVSGPITPTTMASILEFEKRRGEDQESKMFNRQYARSLLPTVASDPETSKIVSDVANTGRNFTPEESQKIQQTQRVFKVLTEVEDATGRDLIKDANDVGISIPSEVMPQGMKGIQSYVKEEASKQLVQIETLLNDSLRNIVKLDEKKMEDLSKAITRAKRDLDTKTLEEGGKGAVPTQAEIDATTKAAVASVPGLNETVAATLNGIVSSYLRQALTLSRLTGRGVNIRPDVLGIELAPEDKPFGKSGILTNREAKVILDSPDKTTSLAVAREAKGLTDEQFQLLQDDFNKNSQTIPTSGLQPESIRIDLSNMTPEEKIQAVVADIAKQREEKRRGLIASSAMERSRLGSALSREPVRYPGLPLMLSTPYPQTPITRDLDREKAIKILLEAGELPKDSQLTL